mmetsp:Transcript_23378/g.30341  ORF Transcript_23378/g.30341 Transcript_23378/m.30341 type:complete len:80 (-) Transcript_23378:2150-2389(-)
MAAFMLSEIVKKYEVSHGVREGSVLSYSLMMYKACAHANKMNYQLSAKKSSYMVFCDSSWDDMDVNYISGTLAVHLLTV